MSRCFASATVFSAVSMLLIDYVYLTKIAAKPFGSMVQSIQSSPMVVNKKYAAVTYLIMLIGVLSLAVSRVSKESMGRDSLIYGALLGLVMYGVFDFTNLAIFSGYTLNNALLDTAWGVFLMMVVTYIGSYASYNMKWFVN